MVTQYHSCITFEGALKNYKCMIVTENGKQRPAELLEVVDAIADARKKGYTVLPPCENVDECGYCKGHEIPDDEDRGAGL